MSYHKLQAQEELPVFISQCNKEQKVEDLNYTEINGNPISGVNGHFEMLLDSSINFLEAYTSDTQQFRIWFKGKELPDTVWVPKLQVLFSGGMHDMSYQYMNCNNTAEGAVIDMAKDGQTTYEGEFVNGKPLWLSTYDIKGELLFTEYFHAHNNIIRRIDYFAEGELVGYEKHISRKRKTIVKYYEDGELIEKKKLKHFLTKFGIIK